MRLVSVLLPLLSATFLNASLVASTIQPDDRIIFVGDSITGQGGRSDRGWVWLIPETLKEVDENNAQTVVPLGGSGHRVGSWRSVEKKSREKEVRLDVKEYDVGEELDQHADIVVIMLGMNDVLSAGLTGTEEGIDGWKEQYRELIGALRERTTPRVLALATPTPCTEDPLSPKNQVMDQMVVALHELAEEEDCIVLPTRETCWEVLETGRRLNPNYHFVNDQVHPNHLGHYAIAAGMLRGLGEAEAANILLERAIPGSESSLSYEVSPLSLDRDTGKCLLGVTVYHRDGEAKIDWPEGWSSKLIESNTGESEFEVWAILDRLVNRFPISAGGDSVTVEVPAPWLLATANVGRNGWRGAQFDPGKGSLPTDEAFRTGEGVWELMEGGEVKEGYPLEWNLFVGNVNYGGKGDPEVIDFAQVTYFLGGEVGYGLRWIFSEKARPVQVLISQKGFAGITYSEVWLNGETLFSGNTNDARKEVYESSLREGWNLVSLKSNFAQWQWQLGVGIRGEDGDSLEDLRYSVVPPR